MTNNIDDDSYNYLNEIIIKLQQIGFKKVVLDPEGYRPGKINVITD